MNWDELKYGLARKLTAALKVSQIKNSRIDKTARIQRGAQIVNCHIGRYTQLQRIKWWNFDEDQLERLGVHFSNPTVLIKRTKGNL